MQKTGQLEMDDNTLYRLMNNPFINWRSILFSFVRQFFQCVNLHGDKDEKAIKCFVVDDTDLPKTGKSIEGISRIFSHVFHRYTLGFKMLVLACWDGKSLLPSDCSLHRENKNNHYGLNVKKTKHQFHKERPAGSFGASTVSLENILTTPVLTITNWTTTSHASYPFQTSGAVWIATNDPCPSGWQLPTDAEWSAVKDNNAYQHYVNGVATLNGWIENNSAGVPSDCYNNVIKLGDYLYLPAPGFRYPDNGSLDSHGLNGCY
jgi:hypothetical protein